LNKALAHILSGCCRVVTEKVPDCIHIRNDKVKIRLTIKKGSIPLCGNRCSQQGKFCTT